MLDPKTLSDLNQAFRQSPQGFLVVDQGTPRFAVVDYATYKKLKDRPKKKPAGGLKVLITGGAGYIGAATARVLLEHGYEVVVFDNVSTGRRERLGTVRLIVGDLADTKFLQQTFREERFDAVMHLAASIEVEESVKNPAKYFQNNVANSLNLLQAMLENGVNKLVFSSTAAVYGKPDGGLIPEGTACRPVNPYGESKWFFERILERCAQAYGLRAIALRYFNASGCWPQERIGYRYDGTETHLIPRVLQVAAGRQPEIVVNGLDYDTPDRTCVRDYIHIKDLAVAHLQALQHLPGSGGFAVYNVGTARGYSNLEVIETAVEITGRMIPMRFAGRRAGDPPKLVADNSKMKRDWGWQPQYGLQEILESSWQWLQQNKKTTPSRSAELGYTPSNSRE